MNVSEALISRKSIRAFLDKKVSTEILNKILQAASHAPSGTNTQPWQVAVVTGEIRSTLTAKLEKAFWDRVKGKMDYQYYPEQWKEPFNSRRRSCGLQMYETLNISREDKQKKLEQWAANYRGFDAPVILFFFMDGVMETGSFLDYGMFLQSIMLVAQEHGLSTCPQASLAEYPEIVKNH